MSHNHHHFLGRRHGPDLFMRGVGYLTAIGWAVLAIALFFANESGMDKPIASQRIHLGFFDALGSYQVFLNATAIALMVGVIGITLDVMRNHRREDRVHPFFIVLTILALMVLLV